MFTFYGLATLSGLFKSETYFGFFPCYRCINVSFNITMIFFHRQCLFTQYLDSYLFHVYRRVSEHDQPKWNSNSSFPAAVLCTRRTCAYWRERLMIWSLATKISDKGKQMDANGNIIWFLKRKHLSFIDRTASAHFDWNF